MNITQQISHMAASSRLAKRRKMAFTMLKLRVEAQDLHYALLLNHQTLINEAYQLKNKAYELKNQLFQFEPKLVTNERIKKRKRKAASLQVDEVTVVSVSNETLDKYLKCLPQTGQTCCSNSTLSRYWDERVTFPQFHGANSSGQFQKFQFNEISYLIPHGSCFYNHNVEQLHKLLPQLLPSYDIIIMDPPWRNKYIRRLKRSSCGYDMLKNDQLALLPLAELIHERTLVAIWCTNAAQHQTALETLFLPRWKLRLLHKLKWFKLNTAHQLVRSINDDITQKQPYEMLYLACHVNSAPNYAAAIQQVELLLSIPSIIHSHKPPLLSWLRQYVVHSGEPSCLELFARYLQPNCTSIGLEVLKLMDERLYDEKES